MTEDNHDSIYSEATDGSTQPNDVVALGRRIVRELGLDRTSDTLARWMSHRLAELIMIQETSTSERRRNRAAKETEDLVLRLWARRTDWPQGWPPAGAASLIDALTQDDHPWNDQHTNDPLLRLVQKLEGIHRREIRTWIYAAVLEYDPDEIRSWHLEHQGHLDEDETLVLDSVAALVEDARQQKLSDTEDRVTSLLVQLDQADADRAALLLEFTALLDQVGTSPSAASIADEAPG